MFDPQRLRAFLEYRGEQRNVEFKRAGDMGKDYVARVARAAMALANLRGGGVLVLGIDDTDPLNGENGLAPAQLKAWLDADSVNAKINAYADPALELSIDQAVHPNGGALVVIQVHEFRDHPVLCKRDYGDVLAAGQLFTRSAAKPESSARQTHGEMREVIDLAVDKNLARFVQRARNGGLAFSEDGNFLAADPVRVQLEGAFKETSSLVSRPHFHFVIRQEPTVDRRYPLAALRRMVASSEVRHWGWSFPNLDRASSQGQDWVAGGSPVGASNEAWRYYESGLFIDSLAIDRAEQDRRLELLPDQIVQGFLPVHFPVIVFTMVLEFAARLLAVAQSVRNEHFKATHSPKDAHPLEPGRSIVSISAHGIQDWALAAADERRSPGGFWNLYQYGDDVLKLDDIVLGGGTAPQETHPAALTAAAAFFSHFGWATTPELLQGTQQEVFGE